MSFDIHFCGNDEIDLVRDFLHIHWARDHVLSWHRALMDFQHKDRARNRYTFVLARRVSDKELVSVLGFIPTSLYDADLAGRSVIMLALWKVRSHAGVTGLGLRLLQYLVQHELHVAIGVAGINKDHPSMYKALGFNSAEYQQHYMRNWRITKPSLGRFPGLGNPQRPKAGNARLEPLLREDFYRAVEGIDVGQRADLLPAKSPRYFFERFLNHPVYRYELNLVRLEGRPAGILASRLASHEGHHALRIIDYYGEETILGELGGEIDALLERSGAEHADIWSYGISGDTLLKAGFRRVDPDGAVIVPNFFEPFTPQNSRIRFSFKSITGAPFVLFRADGDQDRPNRVAHS